MKNTFFDFFVSKNPKNLYFWPFWRKLVRIAAHGVVVRPREAYNSSKWQQYNPFEVGENFIQIFCTKKFKKSIFWAQKWQKMSQKIEKFLKFFLVGIDLEWFKTCFKTKISILKIFPVENFFLGHSRFFEKLVTKKSKIFRKIFFWSESV